MYGLHERGMPLREISNYLNISLTTVYNTIVAGDKEEKVRKSRGRYPKTSKAQNDAMVEEALKNHNNTYKDIAKKIVLEVSEKTIKCQLAEKNLKKWVAQERVHIDEVLAQKRLEWALAYRHWTKEMWRGRIFRYLKEKWNKDCVEPSARLGERKVSQMMIGFFHGQKHGLFLPIFPDPSSTGGGVTGKSIIDVYDHYDFVKIWEDIKRELGEEELRKYRITLLEIPPYSPDLNPIENIWSLIKDKLSKQYPELQLMKGPEDIVKKVIEEAITYYWELSDPKVFDTLAGSMVDRIKAIIKEDG
ncbi:hypothetical protein L873DRAFT_1787655 [Choiromyces venosus 120613-1]|uniref:Tc1-like transposase DDE domain-containing protein n=1 Tax=Choiromyces venosus 120613-1 TaxID=1336337 RepID=A0A3N4JV59_9PEZI|nr:hypothetical protein L873DRAFT_1787655 [Choiromyces venosus 120613-1]